MIKVEPEQWEIEWRESSVALVMLGDDPEEKAFEWSKHAAGRGSIARGFAASAWLSAVSVGGLIYTALKVAARGDYAALGFAVLATALSVLVVSSLVYRSENLAKARFRADTASQLRRMARTVAE